MNWIDLLAVLPFYYSVMNAVKKGATVLGIDFRYDDEKHIDSCN